MKSTIYAGPLFDRGPPLKVLDPRQVFSRAAQSADYEFTEKNLPEGCHEIKRTKVARGGGRGNARPSNDVTLYNALRTNCANLAGTARKKKRVREIRAACRVP